MHDAPRAPAGQWKSEATWLLLTGMVCAHFTLTYNNGGNRPFLSLSRYAAGQEALPFQARVLMAWVMHALVALPALLTASMHLSGLLHDPYIFVQMLVCFLALFAAIACTRGSLGLLTGNQNFSRWAALLVALMAYFNMPLIYGLSYTLPYDVPALFFFCAGVYCILRRSFLLYYLVFLLGTLNRETICFLALFFAISELSLQKKRPAVRVQAMVAVHLLAQAVLWLGIKLYLRHHFALNPVAAGSGGLFQAHLSYNLRELLKPQQWPLLMSNFAFTLPLLWLQRRWIGDVRIQRACGIVLPLWFLAMLYVGVIVEIRIFTELIAFVALAVALIMYHRYFRPLKHLPLGVDSGD